MNIITIIIIIIIIIIITTTIVIITIIIIIIIIQFLYLLKIHFTNFNEFWSYFSCILLFYGGRELAYKYFFQFHFMINVNFGPVLRG